MKFLFLSLLFFTTFSICSQSKEPLSVVAKTLDKKDKNCTYKIQYPVLKVGKNYKYDVSFVKSIGKILIDDFTKLETYDNEFECNKKDDNAPAFSLNGNFEVKLKNDSILSIYSDFSSYTEGSSYPNNVYKTYNYDLTTGKEITFESLFKKDINYLIPLYKSMTKIMLKEKVINERAEFISLKRKKYDFYLSQTGIHFINLYDEHAMQSVEVKIPYNKMIKYLDIENTFQFLK